MQTNNVELKFAWSRLCSNLGISEAQCAIGFQEFVAHYSEPHRAYHTLAHIKDCLARFELVRDECEHPLAVELAIWFHDLVYNTRRKDNERESAKRLVEFCHNGDVDPEIVSIADMCVRVTAHREEPTTRDERVMIDVDLSVLASDWNTYETYTRQIRQEYKRVSWLFYVLGRRKVIKTFLDRPYIFYTPFYRAHHEAQARANITRELHTLKFV